MNKTISVPSSVIEKMETINETQDMVDTTTSAYGDKGRGRPVPKFIDPVIPKKPNLRRGCKEPERPTPS